MRRKESKEYALAREMQAEEEEEEEKKEERERERDKEMEKEKVYMRGALRSMVRLSRWRNMCF